MSESRCVKCNKCISKCHLLCNNDLTFNYPKEAFAAWSRDEKEYLTSSSGGLAATFYRSALLNDYYIVGAKNNASLVPDLVLTNNYDYIFYFKESKYVYSNPISVFKEIYSKLVNDSKVLFIGLPCQVAALKTYLGNNYSNLITVDIVCHGTPSSKTLKDYIDSIDKKNVVKKVKYRDEEGFLFELLDEYDNIIYKKRDRNDMYMAAFLEGINYRECCYSCRYARPERVADITIGDFWGLGKEIPFNIKHPDYTSLVLINTKNGESFYKVCQDNLISYSRTVDEAIRGNEQLNHPTLKHKNKDKFDKLLETHSFEKSVKICLNREIKKYRINYFKSRLRRLLSILRRSV